MSQILSIHSTITLELTPYQFSLISKALRCQLIDKTNEPSVIDAAAQLNEELTAMRVKSTRTMLENLQKLESSLDKPKPMRFVKSVGNVGSEFDCFGSK